MSGDRGPLIQGKSNWIILAFTVLLLIVGVLYFPNPDAAPDEPCVRYAQLIMTADMVSDPSVEPSDAEVREAQQFLDANCSTP